MHSSAIIGEIIQTTGAQRGDIVCIQSSFRNIESGRFSAEEVIAGIAEVVGINGGIVMPAYNFHSWTEQHKFNVKSTPSEVGFLSEHFRKSKDVTRTTHPIHSLSVWGEAVGGLTAIDSVNSFGRDSVFARMRELNIIYLTLGTGLGMPFLPCHFTEHRVGVGYRFTKNFDGLYTDVSDVTDNRKYGFDVKKEEFRTMTSPVYRAHVELHERNVVKMETVHNTVICSAGARAYDLEFEQLMTERKDWFMN
jgi:aminoglycoside N3'-acetyltransferase